MFNYTKKTMYVTIIYKKKNNRFSLDIANPVGDISELVVTGIGIPGIALRYVPPPAAAIRAC